LRKLNISLRLQKVIGFGIPIWMLIKNLFTITGKYITKYKIFFKKQKKQKNYIVIRNASDEMFT